MSQAPLEEHLCGMTHVMLMYEKSRGRGKQINSSQQLCTERAFFLTAHGELEIVGIKFHDIIYLFKYLFKGIL